MAGKERTTAEWFWLGITLSAGIGLVIGLLTYTGSQRWAVVAMAITASLCFSKTAYDLGWMKAPYGVGKPIRVLLISAVICAGITLLGVEVWPSRDAGITVDVSQSKEVSPFPPPEKTYMVSYGTSDKNGQIYVIGNKLVQGTPSSEIIANGEFLLPYAEQFRLIAICFHMGLTDQFEDDPRLSKSLPTNIRKGWIPLIIPWDQRFITEMGMGAKGTNYVLLLTPKIMKSTEFRSIADAKQKGAYLLQSASGPP